MQISYKPLWHTLLEKGMSKGLAQGKTIERANFIYAMYKKGIELSEIASTANMSIDKVKKIISSKNKTA